MNPGRSSRLATLAAVTHRQHGLFTQAQAHVSGVSKGMVDHRLRVGELVRVDERVYRSALTPPTWSQRLLAACLAGPAAASHRSAAVLWHAPQPWNEVEVTALRHRRRKPDEVIWHESYLLDESQLTEIDGIPVTSPTRTILDLGAVVTPNELLRVLDAFTRRRLTDPSRVARDLERFGHLRPGFACVAAVLALRRGPGSAAVPESDLETVFESLVREAGLPLPRRQVPVRLPDGSLRRIDFAYPERKLGIEVAGAEFHATPERWQADVERMGGLAAAGWMMLLFSDHQVRHVPDTVVVAIRHALAR